MKGYEKPLCILTKPAALALKKANTLLERQNLRLRAFDCFRPVRAVKDFVKWSKDNKSARGKRYYFSRYSKRGLFRSGFIAGRSGHSRGSTVDLALMAKSPGKENVKKRSSGYSIQLAPHLGTPVRKVASLPLRCDAPKAVGRKPLMGALDMGTDFDCFSPLSTTLSKLVSKGARKNRKILLRAMKKAGFRNYSKEWWHFTLKKEPFRKKYFNFPVR